MLRSAGKEGCRVHGAWCSNVASRGSEPPRPPLRPGGVTAQPVNHREGGQPCAAKAPLCQTARSRSVQSASLWPHPHCSSWLGAPRLWWDSCTESPQPTQPAPLEQGERPGSFAQLHRGLARPRDVLPTPSSYFAEASPQLAPATRAPAVTAGSTLWRKALHQSPGLLTANTEGHSSRAPRLLFQGSAGPVSSGTTTLD